MSYAFVQGNSIPATNSPAPITFSNPNAAGNMLIIVTRENGANTISVSDTVNGSWTALTALQLIHTTGNHCQVFYFPNCKAGSPTITITSPGAQIEACIGEYSGILTVSPVDQNTIANNNSASSVVLNSGSVNTQFANEMLFGWGASDVNITYAVGSPPTYSLRENATTILAFEDAPSTTAGSYSASFNNTAADWVVGLITFQTVQPSAGGGSGLQLAMDASTRLCGLRH